MFKIVKRQIRPSLDVEFWDMRSLPKEIRMIMVLKTKNVYSANEQYSDDNLTQIRTAIWKDKESHDAFLQDPIVIENFLKPRDQYMRENGIILDDGGDGEYI